MTKKIATFHWAQLLALAAVHFLIDMFAGMPPAILPAIRSEFSLSLSRGGLLLVAIYLTCNGVQPFIGHLRANSRQPFFLYLGLILGGGICLLAVLPKGNSSFAGMIIIAVISGFGIAIVHPESLRAVHRLKRVTPAVSTAVFMAGGFFGYAAGGVVSAFLVSRYGLKGLYPLVLCPIIGVILIALLKVKLSIEPKTPNRKNSTAGKIPLPFWFILAMAMPAAISTTILSSLLPTALEKLGFGLTFGGLSTTIFGLGGAIGSFVWADFAHRKGELKCSTAALFLVLPFLTAYLVFMESRAAIWILFGAGFCSIAAYTLMITLSRQATGLTLGQRMGFMLGGTWASAYIVFTALLPVAEHFGSDVLLKFSPLGYLASGIFGLAVMLRARNSARKTTSIRPSPEKK